MNAFERIDGHPPAVANDRLDPSSLEEDYQIVDRFGHEWEIDKPLDVWPPLEHS